MKTSRIGRAVSLFRSSKNVVQFSLCSICKSTTTLHAFGNVVQGRKIALQKLITTDQTHTITDEFENYFEQNKTKNK